MTHAFPLSFPQMRMAHLGDTIDLECSSTDPLFSNGIKQIADWIKTPGNEEEMVRIYLNVSHAHLDVCGAAAFEQRDDDICF